jgi:hypothetical protein
VQVHITTVLFLRYIAGPMIADSAQRSWARYGEIIGCVVVGSLGILLLDALTLLYTVYYSDDINVLYPVAIHNLAGNVGSPDRPPGNPVRPLEYLIVLAANNLYLPLWLAASLLCLVGATVLSGLACERLFSRQLTKAGWWVLGVANPLLFYVCSQPDAVSQALSNLLFGGAIFAFVCVLNRSWDQPVGDRHADRIPALLNLIAAALFFTKETAVAAATLLPAASAGVMHFKTRRFSRLSLFSLVLPVTAAVGWILLKLEFPLMMLSDGGRYGLKLDPFTWGKNLVVTLAFPITPLPTSFIGFDLLRPLWILVAVGSVIVFLGVLLHAYLTRPRIILVLLVVVASCAPMILVYSSELYSTMIAPFAVSILIIFGVSKLPWITLTYGLLLYGASLTNSIVYCLGPDFNPFGLRHLPYSIYGEGYQFYPICPIGTTAHVGWDGSAASDVLYHRGVKGRITCTR